MLNRAIRLMVAVFSGLLFSLPVQALEASDVRVVGLFSNAAVVKIQGKRHLLKVGQKSPEGVVLMSANSQQASLLIGGKEYRMAVGQDHGGGFHPRTVVSKQIAINDYGQYVTAGSINGRTVSLLVDTGATSVAMNSEMARALGIDFAAGQRGHATTAGGIVTSYRVTLKRVKVGDIEVRNVRAAVLEGVYPSYVLLGMSFLRHVEMQENNGLLTLTKKY